MRGEHGGLGFAKDIGKVMVFLGHTRKVRGIDRRRGQCRAELCILGVDVQCEVHCSGKFTGMRKCGSAYQRNVGSR